jgi:hypothetical protein
VLVRVLDLVTSVALVQAVAALLAIAVLLAVAVLLPVELLPAISLLLAGQLLLTFANLPDSGCGAFQRPLVSACAFQTPSFLQGTFALFRLQLDTTTL